MNPDLVYLIGGAALLLGVVLPTALSRVALSAPIVLVVVGAGIGLLPGSSRVSPIEHRALTEHLTEFSVLVALMGVGLALDRPLKLRSWATWRAWMSTWRLLLIGMPLAIAATFLHRPGRDGPRPGRRAARGRGPRADRPRARRRRAGGGAEHRHGGRGGGRRDRREGRGALRAHLRGRDSTTAWPSRSSTPRSSSPPSAASRRGACAGSAGSSSARPSSVSWSVPRRGGCSPRSRSGRPGSRCGWPRPASRCWPSPRPSWPTAWPRWPAAGGSSRCSRARSRCARPSAAASTTR